MLVCHRNRLRQRIQRQEARLGGSPRKHNKGLGSEAEKRKKIRNTYLRISYCGQWGPVSPTENLRRQCETCLRVPPGGQESCNYYLPIPIHHWLMAGSQGILFLALPLCPVCRRENPRQSQVLAGHFMHGLEWWVKCLL